MVGPRGYVQHKDITISSPNLIGQNISQSELCLNQRKQQVWHAPRFSLVFTLVDLKQTLQKNTPLPLARQLSPLSRVPVQPVPRVVIVSLEFLVTGVIEIFLSTNY